MPFFQIGWRIFRTSLRCCLTQFSHIAGAHSHFHFTLSSTLTVGNLSMIFKLDVNQGIYIYCEEEGDIILPTELGLFNIEDYAKTYL